MNFSVHIDEPTLDRLAAAVERTAVTRNRIIVQAVREWLDRNEEPGWPEALRQHFRNPAPELAEESLDAAAWAAAAPPEAEVRW
jgi:hypothetical protein